MSYQLGIKVAFDAIEELFKMSPTIRQILFGYPDIRQILKAHQNKEFNILAILDNKNDTLANYVEPGDILARDNTEILVTNTTDHTHFDGIVINGPCRGNVWKYTTVKDSHSYKTGKRTNEYFVQTYDWEE